MRFEGYFCWSFDVADQSGCRLYDSLYLIRVFVVCFVWSIDSFLLFPCKWLYLYYCTCSVIAWTGLSHSGPDL